MWRYYARNRAYIHWHNHISIYKAVDFNVRQGRKSDKQNPSHTLDDRSDGERKEEQRLLTYRPLFLFLLVNPFHTMVVGMRAGLAIGALWAAATTTVVNATRRATTSTTGRRLEDFVEQYKYDDLSQFSLHFDKCQDIRMYDDEIAAEGVEPFSFRSFVAFRISLD